MNPTLPILILFPCLSAQGILAAEETAKETAEETAEETDSMKQPAVRTETENQARWKSLFNGKNLAGWASSRFGGDGELLVKDGQIVIEWGATMSGIKYEKKLPKINYEVRLEAKRVAGNDFFCGLTFPVKQSHCTLIVGGWAGSVVGLSNIDGQDASANETTQYLSFEEDQWYKIRVRVTASRIVVWIDQKQIIDQSIQGRAISLRSETLPSRPLGIATWQTTAALRKIEIRSVHPARLQPDPGHDTLTK